VLAAGNTEAAMYINQPILAHRITKKSQKEESKELEIADVVHLLNTCSMDELVVIYGGAGMGKTSMLIELARLWAEGESILSQQYDFVFPIFLRRVQGRAEDPIVDIFCKDMGLLPLQYKAGIERVLNTPSIKCLFLFDSFEELSIDNEELTKLLQRKLYQDKAVLVTSRPGSRLTQIIQDVTPRVEGKLQGFSEVDVKKYIEQYPQQHSDAFPAITKVLGMAFLQIPINLALLCFFRFTTTDEMPSTQTEIFGRIFQHITQESIRKEGGKEFTVASGSPLNNSSIPPAKKVMVKEMAKLCYDAVRQRKQLLHLGDNPLVSKQVFLDFGLFTEGPD
jgi:hypothetical protein